MHTKSAVIARNSAALTSSDGPWEYLGYRRCPAMGVLWRIMTPRWKAALASRAFRELILLFSAAHIVACAKPSEDLIPELAEYYWRGVGGRLRSLIGISTRENIGKAIEAYVETPSGNWHNLLWERLEGASLPERQQARLWAGCFRFCQHIQMIDTWIKSYGLDIEAWPKSRTVEELVQDTLAWKEAQFAHEPTRDH
jgi:hypothetical protein